MKLESIAIQEFKQFTGRLVVDDLQPGLNLFTGPNEAGKSTIAEAVRAVFLERYKASHLKDLLPWGKASGQPSVEVTFDLDGTSCKLSKQFVSRQRCELRIGQSVFSEDEAEDKLAALLGFSRAARGPLKAENAGVPGLLWVQQGGTQEMRDSTGHAAQYLRDALSQLSGSRESAGEDALIAAVQRELRQLLTARTQKSTGPLAEAEQALAALLVQRDELEQQREQFEENIARLAALQEAFDDTQRKRPWELHEQKAVQAQQRADAAAELERSVQQLAQSLQVSEAELALSLQQEQGAAELEAAVARERQQLDAARANVSAVQTEHDRAAASVARFEQASADANRALDLANAAVSAADLRSQIGLHRAESERLEAAIADAGKANDAVLEAARAAASLEIDAAKLKRLQSLDAELTVLRARTEAAMTRIEYRLNGAITVGEAQVSGAGVLRLDEEKLIGLGALGELRVIPGVSDLPARLSELASLEAGHAQLLQALGVASLGEAEARHEQWKALVAQQKSQAKILEVHAPQGIDALRAALASTSARWQASNERLALLPDVSAAPPLDEARRNAEIARDAWEAARKLLAQSAEKRSTATATTDSLAAQLQRKEAQLNDEAFRRHRAQWQTKMIEQRVQVDALRKQREGRERELEAARLDDPAAEAKRYRASAELARGEQHERQVRIAQLRSQLETVGASGLGERLAAVRARVEQATRRKDELSLRASALSLLDEVLVDERDAAVAQLRAPLTERLGHYLRRIFPQSTIALGDDLSPATLDRYGRADTLDALSFGTREQLGILTRLAYADLLKASGRPTLLMLDDAAVHTDAARRDAIKRALIDAATRHQILVFTCHPELWDDLGVRQRAIDDLKAAA
ncbi:AAA family ATPase [Paraburkholderia sp. 22099]|jgi:DNA repair exonuclease SbcCD ATPase subunit|uniref:DNA repair exonuclease SbcCD ATPase subunit n=2 Tax=Burkholderiaceae TaxID=119060 RepID=A0A1M6RAR3_9BURK|nr:MULTISPECIES: AAA family ATPase [Paraburkholderia]ORC45421.1 GTP-binding protein [Burkholderia sp. A27]AXE96431.1 GTP-binding protein [Paraburkholderia terricola]MDR6449024.1 chromosome segregation ATPase [Paraburkholderia terricola]MDR6495135.1 chromosome segregation ATPase [Paraburkholderia terricola]SDP21069.1 DNA repair exonuclease SbcCD ATPase subunit [Paraburkholderia sediminicola]